MAYDVEGRLIVCEHVSSSISRFHDDGFRETVCFHHDGVYLNSPNDLVSRKRDGYIYFTDPDYGRWNDWIGSKREPLLGYTAVFRVPHEGGPAELVTEPGEFEQPNGLCFSPDESKMYVNDSPRAHIKVFDVADDGTLVNGRVLAEGIGGTIQGGSPDGMECDEFGNVWTTGPGGVWVFDPDSGRADRADRDAGGVRQPVLGWERPANAVPDDVDHGPLDADVVHVGAAPALLTGPRPMSEKRP